jgi:hypothetical protein
MRGRVLSFMEAKEVRTNLFYCIAIFILAIAPFIACTTFGIINLDDYCYVSVHHQVKNGLTFEGVKWAFTTVEDAIWMPLTWLSYMIDFAIAGVGHENVHNWMHAHSLIWHGLNSILLFFFLHQCLNCRRVTAFVGAAFWAMHPLRVESVVWIAGRKDVISMFWLFSALILWISWRKHKCLMVNWRYCASMFCLVLGGMAKPSVMVFIGVVIVIDWLLLDCIKIILDNRGFKMIGADGSFNGHLPYLPPFLVCLLLMIFAAYAQGAGGATSGLSDMPLWARILNAMASFGVYIRNTIWPLELAAECQMKWPKMPNFLIPGIAVSLSCVYFVSKAIRCRINNGQLMFESKIKDQILAGVLIFVGSLIPFLGIANFGAHAFADRFTYIASIGISILLVTVIESLKRFRKVTLIVGCVACLTIGCVSMNQTKFWKDDFTFWSRTLEVDGEDNVFAHIGLAQYYYEYDHGNPMMLKHFKAAFELNPVYTTGSGVLYMIGLNEAGLHKEAQEFLRYFTKWNDLMVMSERQSEMLPDDKYVRRSDLDIARTAALMMDVQLRPLAAENLDRILGYKPRDKHALYLKARLAELNNDRVGMRAAYQNLLEQGEDTGEYVQYRWIRKRLAEEVK